MRHPVTRLRGAPLAAMRLAWAVVALLALAVVALELPRIYVELQTPCAAPPCNYLRPSAAQVATLRELGIPLALRGAVTLGAALVEVAMFSAIGAVIFWLRPDDWMAALTSAVLITFGAVTAILYPAARIPPPLYGPAMAVEALSLITVIVTLYLFPDGRFVPGWSRWLALAWTLWVALSYAWPDAPLSVVQMSFAEFLLVRLFWYGSGVAAQVYRYHRTATPVQRQQTKWVLFGITTALVVFFGLELPIAFVPGLAGEGVTAVLYRLVRLPFLTLSLLLIPISVAISVLHFRLWDVDLLINRTLVYGTLTGALTGIYLASVTVAQFLLRALSGQESDLAIIVSTLAIAALLQPLRGRIQRFIDRRFYRRRYDAARVLEAFSAVTRTEIDLDRLNGALLAAIDEAVQPAHISLWQPGERPLVRRREQ
ncbi:MAG: hypothetical protein DIU80_002035 [Chloroflexota bacterium]